MPAFVHSPRLSAAVRGTSFAGLVHVTDWVPTLVMGAAGMDTGADEDKFDGYNLWTAFNDEAGTSPRKVRDLNEVNIKLIEQRKTNDESRPFSFYSSHSSCSLPFFYLLSLPPSLPPSQQEILLNIDYVAEDWWGDDDSEKVDGGISKVWMGMIMEHRGSRWKMIVHQPGISYYAYNSNDPFGTEAHKGNFSNFLYDLSSDAIEAHNLFDHMTYGEKDHNLKLVVEEISKRLCVLYRDVMVPTQYKSEEGSAKASLKANDYFVTYWTAYNDSVAAKYDLENAPVCSSLVLQKKLWGEYEDRMTDDAMEKSRSSAPYGQLTDDEILSSRSPAVTGATPDEPTVASGTGPPKAEATDDAAVAATSSTTTTTTASESSTSSTGSSTSSNDAAVDAATKATNEEDAAAGVATDGGTGSGNSAEATLEDHPMTKTKKDEEKREEEEETSSSSAAAPALAPAPAAGTPEAKTAALQRKSEKRARKVARAVEKNRQQLESAMAMTDAAASQLSGGIDSSSEEDESSSSSSSSSSTTTTAAAAAAAKKTFVVGSDGKPLSPFQALVRAKQARLADAMKKDKDLASFTTSSASSSTTSSLAPSTKSLSATENVKSTRVTKMMRSGNPHVAAYAAAASRASGGGEKDDLKNGVGTTKQRTKDDVSAQEALEHLAFKHGGAK